MQYLRQTVLEPLYAPFNRRRQDSVLNRANAQRV